MRSKKAFRNILAAFGFQFVSIISGFIIPRIIIGSFGSATNGMIASVSNILGYISLLEAGIGGVARASLYKPLALNDKETIENTINATQRFFRNIALIYVSYLFGIALMYPVIVDNEFDYFFVFSITIIIGFGTLIQYYLWGPIKYYCKQIKKKYISVTIQIIIVVLNAIAVVVLIQLGASIHIVKIVSSLVFVFKPIYLYVYVKHKYGIHIKRSKTTSRLHQKWDGFAHELAYFLRTNSDILIITVFLNIREVSVYTEYRMVVSSIEKIINTFASGVEAAFGDMIARNEKNALYINFNLYEFFAFSISTVLFSVTALLILPFISLYIGDVNDVNYYRSDWLVCWLSHQ
jgi:O-antigen/teichoic acid export membrane protein